MRVRTRRLLLLGLALAGAVVLFAYLWPLLVALLASGPPALDSGPGHHKVEVVCEGLESPWGLAFAPDGSLFITERHGRLRRFANGRLDPAPVPGVPTVSHRGQGGLLDVALHPGFAQNRLLYLAYTVEKNGAMMTRVARFRLTPNGLADAKIIFGGVPGSAKSKHFGCRLCFGADGKLFFTLGERGEGARAQDLGDLNGKTLRVEDDGAVAVDNPFAGRAGARPEIFSYGHRNAQGMAVQPGTGLIFQTEHGPTWDDAPGGGDEINIVEAGKNYGWPVTHHRQTAPGMVAPLLEYTPALAPSGCCFYTGDALKGWKGDLFFANLRGEQLIRIKLDGREVLGQEVLLEGAYGRLRDVETGPDGFLYLLTSDTDAYGGGRAAGDRLLRIVPAR